MHVVNKCLTLPNLISFARICFIPPFVICLIQAQHHNYYRYIALSVLLVIVLSDVLDGYLANRLGKLTTFMQVTAIIAVLPGNHISLGALAILWCVVVVVTLMSAVNYTYLGVKQIV